MKQSRETITKKKESKPPKESTTKNGWHFNTIHTQLEYIQDDGIKKFQYVQNEKPKIGLKSFMKTGCLKDDLLGCYIVKTKAGACWTISTMTLLVGYN